MRIAKTGKQVKAHLRLPWYDFYVMRFNNQRLNLVGYYMHVCTGIGRADCYTVKVLELEPDTEPSGYVQSTAGSVWVY